MRWRLILERMLAWRYQLLPEQWLMYSVQKYACIICVWRKNLRLALREGRFICRLAGVFHTILRVNLWIVTRGTKYFRTNVIQNWTHLLRLRYIKVSLVRAMKAYRKGRGMAPNIRNLDSRSGWVVSLMPRWLYGFHEPQYKLYRNLCGPQSRSGRFGENVFASVEIGRRIFEPLA